MTEVRALAGDLVALMVGALVLAVIVIGAALVRAVT